MCLLHESVFLVKKCRPKLTLLKDIQNNSLLVWSHWLSNWHVCLHFETKNVWLRVYCVLYVCTHNETHVRLTKCAQIIVLHSDITPKLGFSKLKMQKQTGIALANFYLSLSSLKTCYSTIVRNTQKLHRKGTTPDSDIHFPTMHNEHLIYADLQTPTHK